jgi:hypothetical protein
METPRFVLRPEQVNFGRIGLDRGETLNEGIGQEQR